MQPGQVRLAVDCGSTCTVAVVVWPDGRWVPVQFDGAPILSSAVLVEPDGSLLTGPQAWQAAAKRPERFESAPLRRIREGRLTLGGTEVDVVDLVAAVFRRVAAEAGAVVGGQVGEVRVVVPAGWGPRRRIVLRQAVHRAGLPQPTVVEAPVAAGQQLLAAGVRFLVGQFVVVCDLGGGFEVTVLRRTAVGFETVSTLADPHAGGLAVDERLAAAIADLTGVPADAAAVLRWPLRVTARTAKEALSSHPAVTVTVPPSGTALVVDTALLEKVGRPVWQRAAELTVQAITAAEISPDDIAGVYCIGGGAVMPAAVAAIGERTGLTPVVVMQPQLAAVFGAAETGTPTTDDAEPAVVVPPVRRAVGLAVPGLASLVLVSQFLLTAARENASPGTPRQFYYVTANWGELAIACVLAMLGCLAAAAVLAPLIARDTRRRRPGVAVGAQIGTGLLAATVLGVGVVALYATGAGLYFRLPLTPFFRWAVLPVLPLAVVGVATAVLAVRWRRAPGRGWHDWLAVPLASVVCAAAGMVLVQYTMTGPRTADMDLVFDLAARCGAALLGVGAALAVSDVALLRVIVAVPLALFCALVVSWPATGVFGVLYALAVTVGWLQRLWHLYRTPAPTLTPAGVRSSAGHTSR